MKKVSVIIPCYNGARTIKRCLNSVLNQSYKNLEVLFVNDSSKDNTLEIVSSYACIDKRIRIINQESNQGVSAARNRGIRECTGDYIQFLDADDEMMPTMISTLVKAIEKDEADIAVSNFTGNPIFYTRFKNRIYDLRNESDMLEYYQDTFCMLLPWNKIYRREVVNVFFDEEVHFAEDELFNLSVLQDVKKITCVNQPLYVYHYAPAEEKNMDDIEEKSCLNKIIEATNENRKNSIWYMGNELIQRRRKILEKQLRNHTITNVDDYLYTRVFDFYFWELSAFAYMGVEKETIVKETMQVFQEPNFIKSLQVQEKYGIKYLTFSKQKLALRVETYIELCLNNYEKIMYEEFSVDPYEIFLLCFLKIFCVECSRTNIEYNKLFHLMLDVKKNATMEAKYFNALMEKTELIGDRIVV